MSGKGKGEGKGKGYPAALSVVKANSNHASQNPSLSRPPVPASQTFKTPGQGRSPSPTGKKGHLQKDEKPGGLFGIIGSWFEEADPKLTPKPESGNARTGASSPEKKRSPSPPRAQSRPKPLPGEQRRVTGKKPPPKTEKTGGFDFGCCTSRPKDVDEQDDSQSPSRISSPVAPTSKSVMQANRASQNPSLSPPPVKGASLTSKSAMQANRASQNPSLSPPPVQGHRSSQTLKKTTSPRKPSSSPPPRVSKGPASQLPQSPSTISNPNKEPLRPFAHRLQEPWSPSKVRSPQGTPPQKTLAPSTSTISVHGVDHHRARLEGA